MPSLKTLMFQYACLESEAAASDPAFIERTLKRYATLKGGEPGSTDATATIAKSRAMLHGRPKRADCERAIKLLEALVAGQPKNVQAKRLLAAALSYSDASEQIEPNLSRAVSLLTEATVLEPANSPVAIELAQVLRLQGQFDKAKEQLVRIAANQDREDYARRKAAEMLVEQGDRSDVATRTWKSSSSSRGPRSIPRSL
jgi:Flp pilus assembly protein TadD